MEENVESPFAAFAAPKRSAVEEFQEKQRNAARSRRLMMGSVLTNLVGAVGGSTFCIGFEAALNVILTASLGALAGGIAGAVIGLFVGACCFGALTMTAFRGRPSIETNLARRDPMTTMKGLLFAWALIGTALGAAAGARVGAEWADANRLQLPLENWTVAGSILGGGFALAMWSTINRRLRSANDREEPVAADS